MSIDPEARPLEGGPALRLARKADVDFHTRLISSVYLSEEEFAILVASLSGVRIRMPRHRLGLLADVPVIVDEFRDELAGFVLAEAELKTAEVLAAYPTPDFAAREVTDEPSFSSAHLAIHGPPSRLS